MKYLYCLRCHTWFDARLDACSQCGHQRPAFNKTLRTADLNKNLYAQIEHAKSS